MIEIIDYQNNPPTLAARFWWSNDHGLTCDEPRMVTLLKEEGIALPGTRIVFPRDGRVFFDALRFGFTGLLRAQVPITVDLQEGLPV